MKDIIKHKVKNAHYYKFGGVAPDGFVMIPTETLERLKDFDFWKEWINDESLLEKQAIEDTKDF